jgi:folate-dependent phosphoribosylglycinamide formyltransferase PurN
MTVAGQALFSALLAPVLRRKGAARIASIKRVYNLDDRPITARVTRVATVNSRGAQDALRGLAPKVVVVNGTRIISRETLACVSAPFLNTHTGITPQFRGSHGGYWALATARPELVGTTVHVVDEGVDTGGIVAQAKFAVTGADSIATYPYLHIAAGLPLLLDAVRGALTGTLRSQASPAPREALYYQPTLWGYVATCVRRGVR